MQRIISLLVRNKPGVLFRICGLISRRVFNIDSITVGVTDDCNLSRMTIVMMADDATMEQVKKQLLKLLDVKAVHELSGEQSVAREVALIKINVRDIDRKKLMNDVNAIFGRILDMGVHSATIELTGTCNHIDECIETLRNYGIIEIARTGMVALESGDLTLKEN